MSTQRWIGGGNNRATNPADWDSGTAPINGDTLRMFADAAHPGPFVLNVRGNELAGDRLDFSTGLGGTPVDFTANLSHHATLAAGAFFASGSHIFNLADNSTLSLNAIHTFASVNVSGADNITLAADESVVDVNLARNAHLNATLNLNFSGSVHMEGAKGSKFNNNGVSTILSGGRAVLDTAVTGIGSFDDQDFGFLEFGGPVGTGQTINLDGRLQIDRPDQFHGHIVTQSNDFTIDLEGLANADSYTFQNDILKLWSGHHVIDTLRFSPEGTLNGFVVEPPSEGHVTIAAITDPNNHPVGLPLHA